MVTPETQRHPERASPDTEERRVREEGPVREERRRPPRRAGAGIVFGSSAEVVAGGGAVVLGILGLLGLFPLIFAAVATLAIGAAIMLEGASVGARIRSIQEEMNGRQARRAAQGGVSAEMLGGGAGVVLAILALVGIAPLVLLPVAALVYGATLLLIGVTRPALVEITGRTAPARRAEDRAEQVSEAAVLSSGGALVLAGAATAVMGILVLADVAPVVPLVLISMIVVGAALLLSGSTLAARAGRALRR